MEERKGNVDSVRERRTEGGKGRESDKYKTEKKRKIEKINEITKTNEGKEKEV